MREGFLETLRFWSDRGVDGFRVDVAHMLTKDLREPLPSQAELDAMPVDGFHPTLDRDDVQEVYGQWREVLNSYDPPRAAVAEAWVEPTRVVRYAHPTSLGQAFNFDLLLADFDAAQFRQVITDSLALTAQSGSSSTWVLSNHDVVRHATRYGLPPSLRLPNGQPALSNGQPAVRQGQEWLLSGGIEPALDPAGGLRRARAATLMLMALPGSAYLYQGEEIGLHEVVEITDEQRQDPTFIRSAGTDMGRDGCRVPLPWNNNDPSFGFGAADAQVHLPQPAWFARHAVSTQEGDADSTLQMYRTALRLRRDLQTSEDLTWVETDSTDVLHFTRPNGWQVITNFGTKPYPLGADRVVVASAPLEGQAVPAESTVWLAPDNGEGAKAKVTLRE